MRLLRFDRQPDVFARRGFTLIELMVVVVIIGLIAGAVVVRTTGITRQARLEWSVGQLIQLDGGLRGFARSRGEKTRLEIELGTNRIKRSYNTGSTGGTPLTLGENVVVRRFVLPTREASSGTGIIEYSSDGITPTYALEVESTGDPKQTVWLVFVGTTGQVERRQEEREVIRLVRTFGKSGDDAR